MKLKARYSICINESQYEVMGLLKTSRCVYLLMDANLNMGHSVLYHDAAIDFNRIIFKKCEKYYYREYPFQCMVSKDLENALIKFENET